MIPQTVTRLLFMVRCPFASDMLNQRASTVIVLIVASLDSGSSTPTETLSSPGRTRSGDGEVKYLPPMFGISALGTTTTCSLPSPGAKSSAPLDAARSEEHTSELQSRGLISY